MRPALFDPEWTNRPVSQPCTAGLCLANKRDTPLMTPSKDTDSPKALAELLRVEEKREQ